MRSGKVSSAQGVRAGARRRVAAAASGSSSGGDGRTVASHRLGAAESARGRDKQLQQEQKQLPCPLPFRAGRATPALTLPPRAQTPAASSGIGPSV